MGMRRAQPNQVQVRVPNLIRAAKAGRAITQDDLREPGSSVSGRPAQKPESGSACASPAM
jgi:hypothetical protein